jgi:hypothetical protein
MPRPLRIALVLLATLLLHASSGLASAITYTDRAAFDAAAGSGLGTVNFDALADETVIPSGGSVGGATFTYLIAAGLFNLEVINDFQTTSPHNSLGTTGDDTFVAGDVFNIGLSSPATAIGLYVIGSGLFLPGDFTLSAGSGLALSAAAPFQTLSDDGQVFFLGVIDPAGFTNATFTSIAGSGAPFNVDDIVSNGLRTDVGPSPVPEPASLLLLGSGLFAAGVKRSRDRRARRADPDATE